MRLAAYASVAGSTLPSFVSFQDKGSLRATVLVGPLKSGIALTALRVEVQWAGKALIACPELARPIRRAALHAKGFIEVRSREIMERFQLLLAQ